jgi:hypothetical protein
LETEDSLVELICRLCHSSPANVALCQFVRFELLSVSTIQQFVALSREFLDDLNIAIWDRICTRLIFPWNDTLRIGFHSNSPLQGIIAQPGNSQVVKVTESSQSPETHKPRNVANLTDDSKFHLSDQPNQSVCYDFMHMRLRPMHYSLRS